MLAGNDRDRFASIDCNDVGQCIIRGEVELPASERERGTDARFCRHITDVSKPFCAQQLFGNVLRCNANAVDFCQPDGGGFGRCLLGKRFRRANKAKSATATRAWPESGDDFVSIAPPDDRRAACRSKFSLSDVDRHLPSDLGRPHL